MKLNKLLKKLRRRASKQLLKRKSNKKRPKSSLYSKEVERVSSL